MEFIKDIIYSYLDQFKTILEYTDIINNLIKQNPSNLRHIKNNKFHNEENYKLAVQSYDVLGYAPDVIKDNFEIISLSVQRNIWDLQHASPRLRDSYEIVELAVRNNGLVLQYASPRLRDNDSIVELAVRNNGTALQYESPRLRDDYDMVRFAMHKNSDAIKYASPRLQNTEINWY